MSEVTMCAHPGCDQRASRSTTSKTFLFPRCKKHIQEFSAAYYEHYGKPAPKAETIIR